MDPQTFQNAGSRESLSRTRSISAHFPQIPSSMHPYADGIHSFFESTVQNPEHQSHATSSNFQDNGNVNFEENDESAENSRNERDQLIGQRNNIREGFEQFRQSLDNTREGQTIMSILKNVLPFLVLFAAKFVFDHIGDITHFLILFITFLQGDIAVQKIFAGGLPNKFLQVLGFFWISVLTVVYLRNYSMTDFEFSNTFGLNISYFVSGEFTELSLSSTLYGVIMIDTSFKLITVVPKSLIVIIPEAYISSSSKRKLLQSTEYCSELYRCALPFGPWIRHFFFAKPSTVIMNYLFAIGYFCLKVGEVYRYSLLVKKSVRCLLIESSVGSSVKTNEYNDQPCTVCHGDLSQPIKLECKHVFCKACIETWLDQKSTCPMCRAEVTKDVDNDWKNGGTSIAFRAF